jgi:hypothetical protein
MLRFDARKFLSLPVNNGREYLSEDGCGCAKGNFFRASSLSENLEGANLIYLRECVADALPPSILDDNTGYQKVMDRAEKRHLQGRPQYAKLFAVRALRMYKLVEFVGEEVECQTTATPYATSSIS